MKCCASCGGQQVSELQWRDVNDGSLIESASETRCWDCNDACTLIDASEYEKRHGGIERTDAFGDDLVNECKAILLGLR